MDCMEMDDSDMAFVVDEEGRVIFAPKESMAGLPAADVSLGAYNLAQILSAVDGGVEEDGNFSIHLDYGRDSGTIRKRRVGNSGRGRCLYGVRGSSRLKPVSWYCKTGHQLNKEHEPCQPR